MKNRMRLRNASRTYAIAIPLLMGSTLGHAEVIPADDTLNAQHSTTLAAGETVSEEGQPRFGVSLGMGTLLATGNRGAVWGVGGPSYNLTLLYWAMPHLALSLEGSRANNYYDGYGGAGRVNVTTDRIEAGMRLYGNLRPWAPRLAFISPYASIGMGGFSKSESALSESWSSEADTQLGMSLGAGIKVALIAESVAIELGGKWTSVSFRDNQSTDFVSTHGVSDLSGQFLSWNGSLLVTF